jgi:ArsR family transcriptional regulator
MSPFITLIQAGIFMEVPGDCETVACASARAAFKKPISATTEMVKAARLANGRMPHILCNVSARMLAEGGEPECSTSPAALKECDNSQISGRDRRRGVARRAARRRGSAAACIVCIHECRFIDVRETSTLYRLLGDEARLRLLRVLRRERLNVTELTGILGLAQSGVSRHLGLLKDAGLVVEEKDAGFTFYRVSPQMSADDRKTLWLTLEEQFARAESEPAVRADEARLQEVLRLRKENFDTHGAADTRDARQLVPGRSWAAWSRALGLLLPPLRVADLGCGEGYLTIEAARFASRVIAVDRSPIVLERAKGLARRRRVSNVIWKRGELEKLPIRDDSVDVALLSQALHHAQSPDRAVAEATRITVPGGRVLLLDLRAHGEDWVRTKLGDRRLGFRDEELARMLTAAGLRDVRVGVGARKAGDPFTVLVASGTKPQPIKDKRSRRHS